MSDTSVVYRPIYPFDDLFDFLLKSWICVAYAFEKFSIKLLLFIVFYMNLSRYLLTSTSAPHHDFNKF